MVCSITGVCYIVLHYIGDRRGRLVACAWHVSSCGYGFTESLVYDDRGWEEAGGEDDWLG